jgi:hypothetical protein
MSVLRYIAVYNDGQVDGLSRIIETETAIWGEYYFRGQWIKHPSVMARYEMEPGPDDFFHDEQRAQELMKMLDIKHKSTHGG